MGEIGGAGIGAPLSKVFPVFRLGTRRLNTSADAADPKLQALLTRPHLFICGGSDARDLSQGPLHPRKPTSDRTWTRSVLCQNQT